MSVIQNIRFRYLQPIFKLWKAGEFRYVKNGVIRANQNTDLIYSVPRVIKMAASHNNNITQNGGKHRNISRREKSEILVLFLG